MELSSNNNNNSGNCVSSQQQINLYSNLFSILQALKCQITNTKCNHINCPKLMSIFDHIKTCDKAEDCNTKFCITNISYMKHYLNCLQNRCVCFRFGDKLETNIIFAGVKHILLRNQYIIWRRKIDPFRPHLLWRLSEELSNFTKDKQSRDIFYHSISEFDKGNFENSKGIIIYLNNFAKNANDILNRIQWKRIRTENNNSNLSYQDYVEQINEKENIQKIFNYLKRYSTDVLHNRMRLEPVPIVSEIDEIKHDLKIEIKSESTINTDNECQVKTELETVDSPTNSSSLTPPKSISSLKTSPSVASVDEKVNSKPEKIWIASELEYLFEALHSKICREKEAAIFLAPVDWEAEDIPDYPKIITNPMDLSTIKQKLTDGEYRDPWHVIKDYWLMFNNAWTYNKKSSRVYKMCSNLAKIFEQEADRTMQSIGLCCGRDYVYLPQILTCCTPQMCMVNRDAVYYVLNNEEDDNGEKLVPELGSDKFLCCDKCYNDSTATADAIQLMLNDSTTAVVSVNKFLFTKMKNNVKEQEEFIKCKICLKKWHKVCAEHVDEIWGSGFYCHDCESSRPFPKQKNVLISANLPQCNLSRHIEARIDAWRQKESQTISKVNIRVLSISMKNAEIKSEMKRIFVENGEMPESLPYKSKAIFAFQELADGSEICLFGMHTQEYGSDCPSPNTRRVYLAYLDSVNFFQPSNLRTDFYHRLLISYLEYCQQLGFIFAHIWACPPGEGDDYIFHMHPPSQKLPKPKRLQDWYIAMLDKAIKEGIVVEYSDVFAYSYNSQLMSLSEMPYFEGDYWPNVLEDLLKEESALNADLMLDDDLKASEPPIEQIVSNNYSKKRKLKKISVNVNSKRRRQSDISDGNNTNDIMKRLFDNLERRKENFFVIRLHSQSDASKLPEINDSDDIKFSDLMDGRDKFLALSRDKHLEFSSVRRAKFATMFLCYELHLELRHGVIYSCNSCDLMLDSVRFTCQVCEEFELCESCVTKLGHPHKLHRTPRLDSSDDNTSSNSSCQDGEERKSHNNTDRSLNLATAPAQDENAIKRQKTISTISIIKLYEHADKCRDASCKIPNCGRFRRIPDHTIDCAKRNERSCKFCKQIFNIIREHQRDCRNPDCRLDMCIRKRSRVNSNQTRLYNLASDRRRMQSAAVMMSVPVPMPVQPSQPHLIHPHQQSQHIGVMVTPTPTAIVPANHIDPTSSTNTFTADMSVIRSFIEQMKRDPNINESELQKRFGLFLNTNPRYKEAWKHHSMQRQQQIMYQQSLQNNTQRFPVAASACPPPIYQVHHQQQQYYQQQAPSALSLAQQQQNVVQHVHQPIMQQYRPSPQQQQQQQCYVIQTRQQPPLPPGNQSNHQIYYSPSNSNNTGNNNSIQFHHQQQQQHSNNINTQLQNFNPS